MSHPSDDSPLPTGRRASATPWRITAGISLVGAVGIASFMILPGVGASPSGSVTICHATSATNNPYTVNTVNTSSVNEQGNQFLNGHGTHTGPVFAPGVSSGWGDIIPPFEDGPSGTSFPGYNWNEAGQAIWGNGCRVPRPSPTPTPTPTQTSVTPTPTPTETSATPTPTPTPTPTETSATPTPTPITTTPAPITTSAEPTPTPITTTPAPITTSAEPTTTPTPITSPTMDGTPTAPAPIVTGNPNPNPNNPNPSGGLPAAVPAGEGPLAMATTKPTWLWLLTAAFLAMLVASMHQLARIRDDQ